MMKRNHIPISIATGITIGKAFSLNPGLIFIGVLALGSIFPDIDHPQGAINQRILLVRNKISKIITYGGLAALATRMYLNNKDLQWLIYLIPILIIVAFAKHRGMTHSILGAVIILALIGKINSYIGNMNVIIPFTIGYLSHLVADYFTDTGLELLFPNPKRFRFPITITTNGFVENIIGVIAILISINLMVPIF